MFSPKTQQNEIKSIIFPGPYLLQKFQEDYDFQDHTVHNDYLRKYFPKYYRTLHISLTDHPKSTQNKVRFAKVIHNFDCTDMKESKEEKTLKRLLRTSRKTLKSLPTYQGDHSRHFQRHNLSLYFPNITTLDLSYNRCFQDYHNFGVLTRSVEKDFYRSYGYFWGVNRLVKKLKITNEDLYYWVMLKKLSESKRFLKSLRTLQFQISGFRERSMMRRCLVEFLKNKEALEHVTHLMFGSTVETICFWQLIESLINSCQRLYFLSLSIHFPKEEPVYFSVNFCELASLQELELKVNCLATFISRVELPHSLRKIMTNYTNISDLLAIFGDGDKGSQINLEKYTVQQSFFEKWKNLCSLKVLELIVPNSQKVEEIFKNLVVPLLKAIPQLETFIYRWSKVYFEDSPKSLDLNILLEGIEPLRSLKNLEISPDSNELEITLTVTYNPRRVYFLPHVSLVRINAEISGEFDLKKFTNTFLYNVKLKTPEMNKTIKLSSLRISCLKQFIKAIQVLHVLSELKTVEFEMKINIFEQTLDTLMENFRYPVYIAKNLLLTVEIRLVDSRVPIYLTEEEMQHLKMVFGQFSMTINYTEYKVTCSNYRRALSVDFKRPGT